MVNSIQNKFDNVVRTIEEDRISDFLNVLKEFHDDLTCNCFFRNQDQHIYEKLLEKVNSYEDWKNPYEINLIKGFVYYLNKIESESYFYLTQAIGYKIEIDIPFSLRAQIKSEINPANKDDAINAVLLNPNPRNYFLLGSILKEYKEVLKAQIFYGKAIQINPYFNCAYKNRASIFVDKHDYKNAILDYKNCFEINPDQTTIYMLWDCYDKSKRYGEAIEYAILGVKTYPHYFAFKYALGVANERLENYELALQYLHQYLETNPGCSRGTYHLEDCKKQISNKYHRKASSYFLEQKYDLAYNTYNEYITKYHKRLYGDHLENYLNSFLRIKIPNIEIGIDNPYYKRLKELINSYEQKRKYKGSISKDERSAYNLMIYSEDMFIKFGKFRGNSLMSAIRKDPEYILWCVINVISFALDNFLFFSDELKAESVYYKALEINLIKNIIVKEDDSVESGFDGYDTHDNIRNMNGDWGGLYGDEAEAGYWNTE